MTTTHHKTIVMSDIHLGSKWSKTKEATRFLRNNSCETLILCGDIFDGWAIMRGKRKKWKRRHTNFVKALLDVSHTTEVVYVMGNHDDFWERIIPFEFLNIRVVRDWVYESCGKRYFVLHGDVFDHVTSRVAWLARLGDVGYSMLLWANSLYNRRRILKGQPYYSIAQEIKKKVKGAVSWVSDFERHVVEVAREKGCDGVICGHIHQAQIDCYDGIMYLNSGDWVESLSALTEDFKGNWSIYRVQSHETAGRGDNIEPRAQTQTEPQMQTQTQAGTPASTQRSSTQTQDPI